MTQLLFFIILLTFSILLYFQLPKLGRLPRGERLRKILKSPHYKNGAFQNLVHTRVMPKNINYFSVFKELIFSKNKPSHVIPATKTDLLTLDPKKNVFVWFGHSSYFIQIDGKKILVDPVLSGYASPSSFIMKAFKGSDVYTTDDIPEIDYLFITHDHWDHLDYETVLKLKPKVRKVITGLGTGEHFEYWGFDKNTIVEVGWNEKVSDIGNFNIHAVPARHFSGRGFIRNKALWTSFVLQTPTIKIFIGGDGGYGSHFSEIGKTFGKFDLAILENGQYNQSWRHIHSMPEETLKAAQDLGAKKIIPVHNSKFALANHAWDEPLKKVTELNGNADLHILTPLIGEEVDLDKSAQSFSRWWSESK